MTEILDPKSSEIGPFFGGGMIFVVHPSGSWDFSSGNSFDFSPNQNQFFWEEVLSFQIE